MKTVPVHSLRKEADEYRRRAEGATDDAVRDSLLLLAWVCDEEANQLEKP